MLGETGGKGALGSLQNLSLVENARRFDRGSNGFGPGMHSTEENHVFWHVG